MAVFLLPPLRAHLCFFCERGIPMKRWWTVRQGDVARKRRLIRKLQKAGHIDELERVVRECRSWNKRFHEAQRLRVEN